LKEKNKDVWLEREKKISAKQQSQGEFCSKKSMDSNSEKEIHNMHIHFYIAKISLHCYPITREKNMARAYQN